MKPMNFALIWGIFLGSYIVFFILADSYLSETWIWKFWETHHASSSEAHLQRRAYGVSTLSIGLVLNIIFILSVLSIKQKFHSSNLRHSTWLICTPSTLPIAKFTLTWLAFFASYVVIFVLIFAVFPERWLWELVLNNYDFIGDPLWDSIYESVTAFLALIANAGLIYFTLTIINKARPLNDKEKLREPPD